jgi:hypothetical protein
VKKVKLPRLKGFSKIINKAAGKKKLLENILQKES